MTESGTIVWDHTVSANVHRAPRYWEESNGVSEDWLGRDRTGRPVSSGVYFYCVKAPGLLQIHALTLMR